MAQPTPDEWLTVSPAARFLGVSAETVRDWADKGKLPFTRTPGNQRRFRRADLEAILTTEPAA